MSPSPWREASEPWALTCIEILNDSNFGLDLVVTFEFCCDFSIVDDNDSDNTLKLKYYLNFLHFEIKRGFVGCSSVAGYAKRGCVHVFATSVWAVVFLARGRRTCRP